MNTATARWFGVSVTRAVAISVFAIALIPIVNPSHALAQSTKGLAWTKTDFTSPISYNGESVVGTEQWITVHRAYIERSNPINNDQFLIKQLVITNDGVYGDGIFQVAGFTNHNFTIGGSTTFRAFLFADLGDGQVYSKWGDTGGIPARGEGTPPWYSHDQMLTLRLRMRYHSVCGFQGNLNNPNCSGNGVEWEFEYDFGGADLGKPKIPMSYAPTRYPIKVRVAHHGYYTSDFAAENDIHITAQTHQYYRFPECSNCSLGQGSDWPLGYVTAWKSHQLESLPDGEKVRIWPTGSEISWDICSGACPKSSCGCASCDWPAYDPTNTRWLPGQYWPVTWTQGPGFGSRSAEWLNAMKNGVSAWNATGFQPIHASSTSGGKVPITGVSSDWRWGAENGAWTSWYWNDHEYENCYAGDEGLGMQYDDRTTDSVKVEINLRDFDWTSSMALTTPEFNNGRYIVPMAFAVAHEFGHVLGLDHNGAFPDLVALPGLPASGYDHQPFNWNVPGSNAEAVRCLFYRAWP